MAGDSPKYLESLDQVPASGPDPYSRKDKGRAVEYAEAQLEADVNRGNEFDPEEVESIHTSAIVHLATYRLAIDPKSPDAATMGSMADEGGERMDYAEAMRDLYDRAVASIRGAEGDAGDGSGGTGGVGDEEYSPPTLDGGGHIHIN